MSPGLSAGVEIPQRGLELRGGLQFEGVAVEGIYFLTERLGVGLMAGAGFFSPESVYPYADGFVIPLSF